MSAKTLPPPPKDRRRSVRKPHLVEAWIVSPTATRQSEKLEVTSVNISRHGVCFSLAKAIPEGAFYLFEVLMGEQKILSEIRVVACRKDDAGRYDVGAEFC
jgi:c-di-GMP-binding flagellar brake protein YcgR